MALLLLAISCGHRHPGHGEAAGEGAKRALLSPAAFDVGADYPPAEWVGDACGYWPARRLARDIEFVVIHTCEMEFYECWAYLQSCHAPSSSSHYVVQSSDGHVVQMVDDKNMAWHATCLNPVSLGIEHEGYAEEPGRWYSDAMYCGSASLVRWLADRHAIPLDRDHIIGHSEANALYCDGSHWDPGPGWDWDYYMKLVVNGCDPCEPGERRCSAGGGVYVETCDTSGMTWSTTDRCLEGCVEGRCGEYETGP